MDGLVNLFENFAKAANECLYGRGERVKRWKRKKWRSLRIETKWVKIEYISDNGRRLEKADE